MKQVREMEQQIAALQASRDKELEARRWMSSRRHMTNSYGNFNELEESKVNEKYDSMIQKIQRDIDAIQNVDNLCQANKRRKISPPRRESEDIQRSEDESVQSSFSASYDDGSKQDVVIELESSSFDDDSISENSGSCSSANHFTPNKDSLSCEKDSKQDDVIELESSSSDDNSVSGHSGSGSSTNHLSPNADFPSPASEEVSSEDETNGAEGDDDETVVSDMHTYYAPKIKQSKLFMTTQRFKISDDGANCDLGNQRVDRELASTDKEPFDPMSIQYHKKTFYKSKCYRLKRKDIIVGIKRFLSEKSCLCILIAKFDETLLGQESDRVNYKADFLQGTYVQVFKCEKELKLKKLGDVFQEVAEIPPLIYQPQTPGEWYTFGYFYDRNIMKQGATRKALRSIDLFAGAGGSLQGYKVNGFDTIVAVENNEQAVKTLKANNEGLRVYDKCIKQFIQELRDCYLSTVALGHINHVHFSSPCQDFSTANRAVANSSEEIVGPRKNADLSLLLIDIIKITSCETAVFENVVGIWRQKNVHYMLNIAKEIMKLGYQVRCTLLHACDYGDPQKRPRFFMFIAKNNVPMPSIPPPTHGTSRGLWPYKTVKDALALVQAGSSLPNLEGRTTKLKQGEHGHIKLDGNEVAPTLRCGGGTPFHHSEDRLINVREAACLQSFPINYKFYGETVGSLYRQVGNAVPIELSSAVARSFRQVLQYEYEELDQA